MSNYPTYRCGECSLLRCHKPSSICGECLGRLTKDIAEQNLAVQQAKCKHQHLVALFVNGKDIEGGVSGIVCCDCQAKLEFNRET